MLPCGHIIIILFQHVALGAAGFTPFLQQAEQIEQKVAVSNFTHNLGCAVELIAPTTVSAAPTIPKGETAAGRQWWSVVTCGGVFVCAEQNNCGASKGVGVDLHVKKNSCMMSYWAPDVTHRLIATPTRLCKTKTTGQQNPII